MGFTGAPVSAKLCWLVRIALPVYFVSVDNGNRGYWNSGFRGTPVQPFQTEHSTQVSGRTICATPSKRALRTSTFPAAAAPTPFSSPRLSARVKQRSGDSAGGRAVCLHVEETHVEGASLHPREQPALAPCSPSARLVKGDDSPKSHAVALLPPFLAAHLALCKPKSRRFRSGSTAQAAPPTAGERRRS